MVYSCLPLVCWSQWLVMDLVCLIDSKSMIKLGSMELSGNLKEFSLMKVLFKGDLFKLSMHLERIRWCFLLSFSNGKLQSIIQESEVNFNRKWSIENISFFFFPLFEIPSYHKMWYILWCVASWNYSQLWLRQ